MSNNTKLNQNLTLICDSNFSESAIRNIIDIYNKFGYRFTNSLENKNKLTLNFVFEKEVNLKDKINLLYFDNFTIPEIEKIIQIYESYGYKNTLYDEIFDRLELRFELIK